MKTTYQLYPLWLRIWHWSNVVGFLVLIVTGVSLHFATSGSMLIPFNTARVLHNIFGIGLSVGWLIFLIGNFKQGNIVHYKLRLQGLLPRLIKQAMFYGVGIFKGEHHPFPSTAHCKFNPLQQVTYIFVMFVVMPGLIISGLLFFFPELAPEKFLDMDGLWIVGVLHYVIGVFLVTFMIGHIYLATAGEEVTSEFKKMLFGSKLTEER